MSIQLFSTLTKLATKLFLLLGRISVDLRELQKEATHNLWRDVDDGDGRVNFLVTISGTTRGDSPSNLSNWEEDLNKMKHKWIERYVRVEELTL